ncbi:MAG: AbrB/MazE/SpoVT family DNA-binding domain-containing protein [Proteobacteria bacterium]|nr:AbrB/MazE/SpoVT family DNA-binding domain-containing protein [Pseudomonadota bacterium]
METKDIQLKKWGNSVGLRIPVGVLRSTDLKVNDLVSVSVSDGIIMIKPSKKKYSVKELIKGHEDESELDWGASRGIEV